MRWLYWGLFGIVLIVGAGVLALLARFDAWVYLMTQKHRRKEME